MLQAGEHTQVKKIKEYELEDVIFYIKNNYMGEEVKPLEHEIFRFKMLKGAIVIFKDNRILKTRNEWFEYRALRALASRFGEFKHGMKFNINGSETEVDGVSIDNEIMVEIKRDKINQAWVDFYKKKMENLNFKQIYLVGASFEEELKFPDSIYPFIFKPDWESIRLHYEKFEFPDWIADLMPHRHFRFLLPNGRWKGAKRKFTKTAKHTPESKFKQAIKWLKYWLPAKIYYTMARMVNPPAEYFGRGYPIPKLIAVMDIDADSHVHIVGTSGYCQRCIVESKEKLNKAKEILLNEGYEIKSIFSGKKGFHLYILKDNKTIEVNPNQLIEIMHKIKDLTDSVTFLGKEGFDTHRIIKVPNSVDATTGMIINEGLNQLSLKDQLFDLF
ncbi:MAG: hypothetical protein EAX96_06005 [Candidatus Lokiarchaeota archaeon]|nr:hypothetical protein [Candidatus Lokiarchaeota archaeon]